MLICFRVLKIFASTLVPPSPPIRQSLRRFYRHFLKMYNFVSSFFVCAVARVQRLSFRIIFAVPRPDTFTTAYTGVVDSGVMMTRWCTGEMCSKNIRMHSTNSKRSMNDSSRSKRMKIPLQMHSIPFNSILFHVCRIAFGVCVCSVYNYVFSNLLRQVHGNVSYRYRTISYRMHYTLLSTAAHWANDCRMECVLTCQ